MLNAGADPNLFRPGELALLLDRKSRRYMVTLKEDDTFHSHLGRLQHDQLIGGSVGGWYRTDRGHTRAGRAPHAGRLRAPDAPRPADYLPEGFGQHRQVSPTSFPARPSLREGWVRGH